MCGVCDHHKLIAATYYDIIVASDSRLATYRL